MIYYVECIPPGTWLLQQLYSKFPLDQLELGCLFDGLSAYLETPTLGGRSAAGYGQVQVTIQGKVGDISVNWPQKESDSQMERGVGVRELGMIFLSWAGWWR